MAQREAKMQSGPKLSLKLVKHPDPLIRVLKIHVDSPVEGLAALESLEKLNMLLKPQLQTDPFFPNALQSVVGIGRIGSFLSCALAFRIPLDTIRASLQCFLKPAELEHSPSSDSLALDKAKQTSSVDFLTLLRTQLKSVFGDRKLDDSQVKVLFCVRESKNAEVFSSDSCTSRVTEVLEDIMDVTKPPKLNSPPQSASIIVQLFPKPLLSLFPSSSSLPAAPAAPAANQTPAPQLSLKDSVSKSLSLVPTSIDRLRVLTLRPADLTELKSMDTISSNTGVETLCNKPSYHHTLLVSNNMISEDEENGDGDVEVSGTVHWVLSDFVQEKEKRADYLPKMLRLEVLKDPNAGGSSSRESSTGDPKELDDFMRLDQTSDDFIDAQISKDSNKASAHGDVPSPDAMDDQEESFPDEDNGFSRN